MKSIVVPFLTLINLPHINALCLIAVLAYLAAERTAHAQVFHRSPPTTLPITADALADDDKPDARLAGPWHLSLDDGNDVYGYDEFDYREECPTCEPAWTWKLLPDSLIFQSYMAGAREPRISSFWAYEKDDGWIWDIALGGRVGLLRYGSLDETWPEGWQLDIEGAAFPRLDLEENRDMVATDFRFGVPFTYGIGPYQTKLAYYHLSSHIGDEFLEKNAFTRVNFSRDVIVWGHSLYVTDDVRIYGEVGWAFYVSGGTKPFEFQFGVDYSPRCPAGFRGAPFVAVNAHLREEVHFGGNLVVQAGWQWRGWTNTRVIRAGLEYFNGKSDQYEFFDASEQKVGVGLWFDY